MKSYCTFCGRNFTSSGLPPGWSIHRWNKNLRDGRVKKKAKPICPTCQEWIDRPIKGSDVIIPEKWMKDMASTELDMIKED
jgi:hypothetical protein